MNNQVFEFNCEHTCMYLWISSKFLRVWIYWFSFRQSQSSCTARTNAWTRNLLEIYKHHSSTCTCISTEYISPSLTSIPAWIIYLWIVIIIAYGHKSWRTKELFGRRQIVTISRLATQIEALVQRNVQVVLWDRLDNYTFIENCQDVSTFSAAEYLLKGTTMLFVVDCSH